MGILPKNLPKGTQEFSMVLYTVMVSVNLFSLCGLSRYGSEQRSVVYVLSYHLHPFTTVV